MRKSLAFGVTCGIIFGLTLITLRADPVAIPGGPYTFVISQDAHGIWQGNSIILDGSASFETEAASGLNLTSWKWDLNGDLSYDFIGQIVDVSFVQFKLLLQTAGIIVSPGSYPVTLRVQSETGKTSTATANIIVSLQTVPEPGQLGLVIIGLISLVVVWTGSIGRRSRGWD